MREKVRKLWKLCFNDSPEFTDLYFRLRYNGDVNIAIESGKEVIAALQMLPYPMTFCGQNLPTAYVSGACTHPDYRNRGVMRELLAQAFGKMYHKGQVLTTLIPAEPWLFDYYVKMGYAPVFYYEKRIFNLSDEEAKSAGNPTDADQLYTFNALTTYHEAVYQYFNHQLLKRPCCIQHTVNDFRVILADLQLSGGQLFTMANQRNIIALAITYPDKDPSILHVGELLADTPEAEQQLLAHICRETHTTKLEIITPYLDKPTASPLGMARIIHPKAVLQVYAAAHPTKDMNIALTDQQLSANNGYYYLNNGRCMFSEQRLPGAHLQLSISELTAQILAPENPYMSLMLN